MSVLLDVRRFLLRSQRVVPGTLVVVGVSGGPDSLCLLHVLRELAPDMVLRLHVAHLHHGLRGADADADAAFVHETATAWELPVVVEHADVATLARQSKLSLEEAAREARYRFLARVAASTGAHAVAVGHTADDQVETVLMHFLRGSGIAGLRGMQPASDFSFRTRGAEPAGAGHRATLLRPLLSVSRSEVLDYCAEHGLKPRFDRSNEDTTFLRNRLRHELLPLLETYNPQIRRVLLSSATVLADDYQQLHGELVELWPHLVVVEDDGLIVADRPRWREMPTSLQRSFLREAVNRLRRSLRDVGFVHVENALWLLRTGQAGDRMTLPAGLEVVLGVDRLAIGAAGLDVPAHDVPQLSSTWLPLALPGSTQLDGWEIESTLLVPADLPPGWRSNPDPWQAWLDADTLGGPARLRTRAPGERFQPQGLGGHSKSLAEFFTTAKTPAPTRDRWPLLVTAENRIAWVCGLRVDERAKIVDGTRRVVHVRFRRQGSS
jgi:tRNA(Ile)-lysidine synthetase-like protein